MRDDDHPIMSEPRLKPWHLRLVAFAATVVAMSAIAFRLHIAWFIAAALVVGLCSVGEWAVQRKQRRLEP